MTSPLARRIMPLLVFATVFATHVASPVTTSFDSRWSLFTALSLAYRGDSNLDEYPEVIEREQGYAIERIGPHAYSVYPLGASLMAVPFVVAEDWYERLVHGRDLDGRLRADVNVHARLERQLASALVALTAVIIYEIGLQLLASPWRALILVAVFAWGTSAWSTASRAMWQHAPSMLCLAVALRVLLVARERPHLLPIAGLALGFSYVVRPTNAVSLACLSALVMQRYPRGAARYLLGAGAILAPFLAFNWSVYGALLSPYYRTPLGIGGLPEAMVGNLLSPSRGLLVFSPVLLFALAGILMRLRATDRTALDGWLVAILVLHWIAVSSIWPWWAGDSFGPRFWSDVLPYLMYFTAPVVAQLCWHQGPARRALTMAFAAAALMSTLIHGRGATSRQGYAWNGTPIHIDRDPGRLWDWRDPQFLRAFGLTPGTARQQSRGRRGQREGADPACRVAPGSIL